MHSYTKENLTEYFFEALEMFNCCFDSDISRDNVILEFFVPETGIEIYERLCGKYFPKMLEEAYKTPGYFGTFGAQAFVGESNYGVLIRLDIGYSLGELLHMFLHEISHLFCTRNEIGGESFFDKYCMSSGEYDDGVMNAGYAIWREAIADIMADSVIRDYAPLTLGMVKNKVKALYQDVSFDNPDAKKTVSLIIAYIMISKEIAGLSEWNEAERLIERTVGFHSPLMTAILKLMFQKLHCSPYWKISPDFVFVLGDMYISLIAQIKFAQNLGQRDI